MGESCERNWRDLNLTRPERPSRGDSICLRVSSVSNGSDLLLLELLFFVPKGPRLVEFEYAMINSGKQCPSKMHPERS